MWLNNSYAMKGQGDQRMGRAGARMLGKVRTEVMAFSTLLRSLNLTHSGRRDIEGLNKSVSESG